MASRRRGVRSSSITSSSAPIARAPSFAPKEGCNEMQGFLIGRPKPISDYGELVGREKTRSASVALAG